eukprot:CAMPEP_0194214078 /NCGR_PEP_ID=MMETSP0156-20130528/15130_1 /TAXON_ID=33649 /ORGANISM="Thalassionema nitzschioides, Strain L26-B" /LENGTH=333 /DNA_ID=CAMNT_0038942259 /DNA_START=149 /DNA_END=1147 /DNA_ORIENTATION=-
MDLFFIIPILFTIVSSNAFYISHSYTTKSDQKVTGDESSRLGYTSLWHSKNASNILSEKKYQALPRLYVGSSKYTSCKKFETLLSKESRLLLDPNQAHYVTRVMRIDGKRRSELRIFDGCSGEWLAKVENLRDNRGRGDVYVQCNQQLRLQPVREATEDSAPWLIFAPLKKARTKLLVEKCTELGTGRFLWINTDRTDSSSLRDCQDGQEKLAAQVIEASEQCERLTLPILSNFVQEKYQGQSAVYSVSQFLDYWQEEAGCRTLLICRERSSKSVPILKILMDDCSKVAFLIGPEGGWSAEEEACFEKAEAKGKVYSVSLGSSVLRAETAAIA